MFDIGSYNNEINSDFFLFEALITYFEYLILFKFINILRFKKKEKILMKNRMFTESSLILVKFFDGIFIDYLYELFNLLIKG